MIDSLLRGEMTAQVWYVDPSRQALLSDIMEAIRLRYRQPAQVSEVASPAFRVKTLEELPDPVHVFGTVEEARDHYGEDDLPPGGSPHHFVYRTLEFETIPPAVNELWVVGLDQSSMAPLKAFYRDEVAQNPILPRGSWPDNYRGEPLVGGFFSTNFRSMDVCERVLGTLIPRMFDPRQIVTMTGDFMRWKSGAPVWADDMMALHGHGYYRILSIQANTVTIPPERWVDGTNWNGETDPTQEMEATYRLERLHPWPEGEEE